VKETGDWIKLHNEELHYLYSLPNIQLIKSRRIKFVGQVGNWMAVTGPERKRPLGRHGRW
jgi:hypothetical protein